MQMESPATMFVRLCIVSPLQETSVKRFLAILTFSAAAASATFAQSGSAVSDSVVRSLTHCSTAATISREPWDIRLPSGIKAEVITVESDSPYCGGQHAALSMPSGRYYLGAPWLLNAYQGTREEKLKAFGWERLHGTYAATIDPKTTEEGFHKVRLAQKTEYGEVVTSGWIDPAGTIYLPGSFHKPSDDLARMRLDAMKNLFAVSPSLGPADAKVTLVEFSDFQCPSCKASSSYVKSILSKYDGRIRYVRIDLPLMSHHPWAFAAAASGRAIHKQDPAAFWKYKDWVYDNQAELSIFSLEDHSANFVADHDLDAKRYAREVVSPELRSEILAGMAAASTIRVAATPSFVVNGVIVDPGRDGAALDAYLATLLK